MNCKDCPYIKDEFDRRIQWYEEYVIEHGIPNDIYGYATLEDMKEWIQNHSWCEKTGGKVWWYGQCSDAHSSIVMSNKVNKKRNNVNFIKHNSKMSKKRERDWKHRNHAKKISENSTGWPCGYYYKDEIYVRGYGYVKNPKPYYKRIYRGQRSKWIKKMCNRSVRRYKGKIPNGGSYKKIDEFWWEMY